MTKNDLHLLSPRYWPAWIGLGFLWLITQLLPFRWLIKIGESIGKFLYLFPTKLKRTTETNLKLCFPEYSSEQRQALMKKNFAAIGAGAIESLMALWLPDHKLRNIYKIHGVEDVQAAFAKGKGILMLGPHFTCIEVVGRLLGLQFSFAGMYRPHKKAFIAYMQREFRKNNSTKYIARHEVRELVRALNNNMAIGYAYDIDGGKERSVFAPFFGIPTASLTAVSRLVNMTGAAVMPFSFYRRENEFGYDLYLAPALENFPSGNIEEDAARLNATLEEAIRKKPEQYMWQYKRFKTRPEGEKRFY